MVSCIGFTMQAQRYPFHNLGVDNGLIQSQALCMAQDKTGNLWIGTLGGLSRYNGVTFTNYTVRNGLLSNTIYAVATDDSGFVWVGSPMGLSRFNGKTFVHYTIKEELPATSAAQQLQVVGDTVWWRAYNNVFRIARGQIEKMPIPGIPGKTTCMLADKSHLWTVNNSTVYHLNGNRWDTLSFKTDSSSIPIVLSLYADRQNTLWIGTDNGLWRSSGNLIVIDTVNGNPVYPTHAITSITAGPDNALWMSTTSGAMKVTANTIDFFGKRNGLSDNYFFSVLTDREGDIWLASDGQGIFRYSGTSFTSLDETTGLPSAQIIALATNKKDSLIMGTYDAGLYVFKDGKISPLPFPTGHEPSITSLCYTRDGKLWIGTRGWGLWLYHNNIFRQYSRLENNFPSDNVTALYEDDSERLWIGFANGTLLYAHGLFNRILEPGKNDFVVSFLQIGIDSVLIIANKKMQLYAAGKVLPFITNAAPDSNGIQCAIKQGNDLWLGSNENGIIRYNLKTHKELILTKNNGLHSDFIYNMVADDIGDIWAGTGYGIHKITNAASNEPLVHFYGKSAGINGMESNGNAALKMPDGSIWFGTTNGAIHYQPAIAEVAAAPVSIVLQSVKLAGENSIDQQYYSSTDNWFSIPYHLRLPYRKNNISFTYQGITLCNSDQLQYRYRMEGIDAPWSDWSSNNTVTFSALPPDNYVFLVQCTADGGKKVTELSYSFEIITPLQQTLWFKNAILIACLLAGFIIQHLITSRKQRRLRLLDKLRKEEQAKIRERTAEDFHDEIGNRLTRINLLTGVLKSKITLQPDTARLLQQIEDNTTQLYGGMRDILWSLKPTNDSLYEILLRIRDNAADMIGDTGIEFKFPEADKKWKNYRLPMDMSRNLVMIFKESFTNILKYANAKTVTIEIELVNRDALHIKLKDDGTGFEPKEVIKGNGIKNMYQRAERLGGRLYIDSRPGKGTITSLTFKIPHNRV